MPEISPLKPNEIALPAATLQRDQFGRILIPHEDILKSLIHKAREADLPTGYLQHYQRVEFLSHHLAYKALSEHSIVEVPEEDGSVGTYRVHLIKTKHNGLEVKALVPDQNNPRTDIKVLFKGTSDIPGVKRDICETKGAGSKSFNANRQVLLGQLNKIVKDFKTARNNNHLAIGLTFAGHSLGGADAQNCMAAVMDALDENNTRGVKFSDKIKNIFSSKDDSLHPSDKNKDGFHILRKNRDALNSVRSLRLYTCNSAGITLATAKRAEKSAEILANIKNPIQLESYNLHVGGDAVQQTGEAHLLSDIAPTIAKTDVMKIQTGQESLVPYGAALGAAAMIGGTVATGGALGLSAACFAAAGAIAGGIGMAAKATSSAHTQHIFQNSIIGSYERLSNETPMGRKQLKAELEYKTSFLNNFFTESLQDSLGYFMPTPTRIDSTSLSSHELDDELDHEFYPDAHTDDPLGAAILASFDYRLASCPDLKQMANKIKLHNELLSSETHVSKLKKTIGKLSFS